MHLNNKLTFYFAILLLIATTASCTAQENKSIIEKKDYVNLVNPFIGTAPLLDPDIIGYTPPENWRVWAGLVFPGSSVPNAMVQLSPMTEYGSGAGFEYEHTEIISFTHTNKGHWNLCNIPILPVSENGQAPFKSSFSHEEEKASPAYYQVLLKDYNIQVRLSSSLRAGIHEYTYRNTEDKRILFDLGKANNRVNDWNISREGNTLKGFQRMGRETVFFYAEVNQDIEEMEVHELGTGSGYAMVQLSSEDKGPVILKVGISFVSSENAELNLKQEMDGRSFDDIHQSGEREWNELLSQIDVTGGTEKQREMFYTSLYRSFLWPALRSDINGEFTDAKGGMGKEDFKYYEIPSLWDTYRNKDILMGLLRPELTNDVIKSLIHRGELTGFMPTFFHGDHGGPFIAGSYFRGIRDFDIKKAYDILLNNAYNEKGPRAHIGEYISKGFISDPDIKNPHVETKGNAGVSKTLEYAYDDYALSLLAKELGDEKHFQELRERSQNYKNVFDKSSNFMRGKLENGDWITPFNPEYPYYEYMYREGTAWQLSFYVPHDMPGLIELYGGNAPFEAKLDSLFSKPKDPKYIARNISGFLGQYSHGNQPGHEAPFSYHFINKPEKSQEVIDNLLNNYYGVGEHELALVGMDDAGEMSSWYVFGALGFYPLSPADPEYLVTVPLFDEIKLNFKNSKEVTIKKPNTGRALKSILVNGVPQEGYFIPHSLLRDGGELEYETK
jgi:predicted alpha-1,2-mannosidase